MTKYTITLYSKDNKALDSFLKFFKYSLKIQKSKTPLNYIKKRKTTKKITVLKSPHVNKTAQEQFEYKIYSIKITFYAYKTKKFLIMLKKIRNQLFPEINLKITSEGSIKDKLIFLKNISLNPNNFTFNFYKYNSTNQKFNIKKLKKDSSNVKKRNLLQKTANYLKLLDLYGM